MSTGSSQIPETGNYCLRTATLRDSTAIFTVNSATTRVCSARDSISSCTGNLTSGKFVQNRSQVMVRVVWSFSQSSAIVYSLAVGHTKSPLTNTPYPVDPTHALINAQKTVEREKADWRRQRRDFFRGEFLEIWYRRKAYSCGAHWPIICLQTAASFPSVWPGASDDVRRSVKDLDRGSNCAENGVSDTWYLITVRVTFLTQSFAWDLVYWDWRGLGVVKSVKKNCKYDLCLMDYLENLLCDFIFSQWR